MSKKPKLTWTFDLAKAWRTFIPFARPSASELIVFDRYYKRIFKRFKSKNKGKTPKSLVLGSTPEFRDLALKNGFDSYCADISPPNFYQLRTLVKRRKQAEKKEKLIPSDWTKLKTDKKFDIIVGDWSINMLPVTKYDSLFRAVRRHLTKEGLFVVRQGVWHPSDRKKVDVRKVVADFRKRYKNWHFFPVKSLDLFRYYFDWRKKHMHFKKFMYGIDDLYEKAILSKKEYTDLLFLEPHRHSGFCISFLMRKHFEKRAKKYFRIIKEEYGKDIFTRRTPIYVMQKK